MDPNETLKQIRFALNTLRSSNYNLDDIEDRAETLISLVESLDGWISSGGFLPEEWQIACRCLYCSASKAGA